jgi:hypothetical protein
MADTVDMALHINAGTMSIPVDSVVIPRADIIAAAEVVHLVAPGLNHRHRHLQNWPLLCHDEGI